MNDSQLSVFRGRLLRAAGITLVTGPVLFACTNEVVVFDDGSGGATSSSGSETNSGSGAGNGSTGNGSGSTGSGITVSAGNGPASSVSVGASGAGGSTMVSITCFPSANAPCPVADDAEGVFGSCTYDDFLYIEQWLDGPLPSEPGECCYEVVANDFCGVGRPYATDAGALVAKPLRRNDWMTATHEPNSRLTDAEREALVAAWTRDGLFEHASVASFSRFALELMSVGAPPDLVAGAHRAALDEIEHARMCFALASRFSGAPIGPDRFPIASHAQVRTDLASIAAATAAEGCIGETLAAALAAAQRDAATDPDVRAALYKIAEDESRHAELAWRTVAWALKHGGDDVHRAVAKVFANMRAHMISPAARVAVPSHGLLEPREQTRVQMHVLTEVIGPCAQVLLESHAAA